MLESRLQRLCEINSLNSNALGRNAVQLFAAALLTSSFLSAIAGYDCNACPQTASPVCVSLSADQPETVTHECYAECQSLRIIHNGSCGGNMSAGRTTGHPGPRRLRLDTQSNCKASKEDIRRFARDSFVFLGCVQGGRSHSANTVSYKRAPGSAGSDFTSLHQLAAGRFSEKLQLTEHRVANVGGSLLYYVKNTISTLQSLTQQASDYLDSSSEGQPAIKPSATRGLLQTSSQYAVSNTTKWPYSNIGVLTYYDTVFNRPYYCTAHQYSPDDIMTSAYCVVDPGTGSVYKDFEFVPGKNGNNEPYGRFGYKGVTFWSAWIGCKFADGAINGVSCASSYLDLATIYTTPIRIYWSGWGYACASRTTDVTSCGYPYEKRAQPGTYYMWCSDGTLVANNFCKNTTMYSTDLYKGWTGMWGASVFDRSTNMPMGVFSATGTSGTLYFAPMDSANFNFFSTTASSTTWATSRNFIQQAAFITSQVGERCITAAKLTNAAPVVALDCRATDSQRWVDIYTGGSVQMALVSSSNKKCIQLTPAPNNMLVDNTPLVLQDCVAEDRKQWFLYDRELRIRPFNQADKCVDLSGTALVLKPCSDANSQKFVQRATAPVQCSTTKIALPTDSSKYRTVFYKSYVFTLVNLPLSFDKATCACRQLNAELASFVSREELTNIKSNLQPRNAWIGLRTGTSWALKFARWADQQPVGIQDWDTEKPLVNVPLGNDCVSVNINLLWQQRRCNDALPFVCRQGALAVPGLNSKTFTYVSSLKLTFDAAQATCSKSGGSLAVFPTKAEFQNITQQYNNTLAGNVQGWIGLYQKGGYTYDVDGTKAAEGDFANGFNPKQEGGIAVDQATKKMKVVKRATRLPFFCSFRGTSPNAVCPAGQARFVCKDVAFGDCNATGLVSKDCHPIERCIDLYKTCIANRDASGGCGPTTSPQNCCQEVEEAQTSAVWFLMTFPNGGVAYCDPPWTWTAPCGRQGQRPCCGTWGSYQPCSSGTCSGGQICCNSGSGRQSGCCARPCRWW